MRVFVYDSATNSSTGIEAGQRRDWKSLLGDVTELEWEGTDFRMPGLPTKGDVLVYHNAVSAVAVKLEAFARAGTAVIEVSGVDQPIVSSSVPGMYRRAKAVRTPSDSHFRLCFDRFLIAYRNTRSLDFSLLEPQFPEHVLACYICAITGTACSQEWKDGFENEVSFWAIGDRIAKELRVPWIERRNATRLRQFLLATRALIHHSCATTTQGE